MVQAKLDELLKDACLGEYAVSIKLEKSAGGAYGCYMEAKIMYAFSDPGRQGCKFVRQKPISADEFSIDEFPEKLQDELLNDDYLYERPNIIDTDVWAKNWKECLEKILIRLDLLKYGYEICWDIDEYREEHSEYFDQEEDDWYSDDDDEEEDDWSSDDEEEEADECDSEKEKDKTEMKKESTSETIKNLWKEMENDLNEKDSWDDLPEKSIVMVKPWTLAVRAYLEPESDHETQLDFVREEAVRKEDFDESSLPADLLEIIKKEGPKSLYPNMVESFVSGDTLEEAIAKMRQKLRLLDYGYILMDWNYYSDQILDDENGSWMLDDDEEEEEEEDWSSDDDDDEKKEEDCCSEDLDSEGTLVIEVGSKYVTAEQPYTVKSLNKISKSLASSVRKVIIGKGVEIIGENAFGWCRALNSIVIPDSVTQIEDTAFAWCFTLEDIVIPDSVTEIGSTAFFDDVSLKCISLSKNTKINSDLLPSGCKIKYRD